MTAEPALQAQDRAPQSTIDPRLLVVILAVGVSFTGFGVALARLPGRVHDLGHSDIALGVAAGLFPVMAISGRLLTGSLIDHRGSRLAVGLGMATTSAGLALFAVPGLTGVLAARAVQGFGDGVLYTAAAASVLDLVPEDRRAQALGWLSAGIWSGLSLGTAISGVFPSLPVAGVVFGCVGALALLVVPSLPVGRQGVAPSGRLIERLICPEAVKPGGVIGLTNFGYAAITGFAVVLYSGRFEHGNWVLAAFGITLLLVRGGLGFLADRIAPDRGLNVAHATLIAGLVIMAVSPNLTVAIIGAMVSAIGHSLPYPILVTATLDRTGPERRGGVLGTMNAGFDIAVATALFAFGIISDLLGTAVVFVVAIGGVIVANLLAHSMDTVYRPSRIGKRSAHRH